MHFIVTVMRFVIIFKKVLCMYVIALLFQLLCKWGTKYKILLLKVIEIKIAFLTQFMR